MGPRPRPAWKGASGNERHQRLAGLDCGAYVAERDRDGAAALVGPNALAEVVESAVGLLHAQRHRPHASGLCFRAQQGGRRAGQPAALRGGLADRDRNVVARRDAALIADPKAPPRDLDEQAATAEARDWVGWVDAHDAGLERELGAIRARRRPRVEPDPAARAQHVDADARQPGGLADQNGVVEVEDRAEQLTGDA